MGLKTVFIIGAGASKEVNLPIGSELKKLIATALDIRYAHFNSRISGDGVIAEALVLAAAAQNPPLRDINPYLHAGWRIRDAMPQAISIDHFLNDHSTNKQIEVCGKLAITSAILTAERESSLFISRTQRHPQLDFGRIANTWFIGFFQLLSENCRSGELELRLASVALIIFNYDRCVEHFLYYAFQNYYSLSPEKAASLLGHLKIYHPYGTVGPLPWQGSEKQVEFGADLYAKNLFACSGLLKTFTEGTDESSSDIISIRASMSTSQKLVFLGFAFHRLNLNLLLPANTPRPNKRPVFATAHGLSASDVDLIVHELTVRDLNVKTAIQVRNDKTCNQLFHEFRRSMSLV